MSDLVLLEELQARLDWTLDSGEQGVANGAIADLSDDARYYGSDDWTAENAPRQVKSLVLRAAARYIRNPDGYIQSRAGDETLGWSDRGEAAINAGTAYYTAKEQQMLATLAGRMTGLFSVPITAWGPVKESGPGYVPVDGAPFQRTPKPFPFYADGVDGW